MSFPIFFFLPSLFLFLYFSLSRPLSLFLSHVLSLFFSSSVFLLLYAGAKIRFSPSFSSSGKIGRFPGIFTLFFLFFSLKFPDRTYVSASIQRNLVNDCFRFLSNTISSNCLDSRAFFLRVFFLNSSIFAHGGWYPCTRSRIRAGTSLPDRSSILARRSKYDRVSFGYPFATGLFARNDIRFRLVTRGKEESTVPLRFFRKYHKVLKTG